MKKGCPGLATVRYPEERIRFKKNGIPSVAKDAEHVELSTRICNIFENSFNSCP